MLVSPRLLDGEASIWHGAGGASEKDQPWDRSADWGLRHDAAWDRHEGGGTDGEMEEDFAKVGKSWGLIDQNMD